MIEIGFADQDRASLKQSRNDGRVRIGNISKLNAGGGGRQARDVDVVLDRKRHAPQWLCDGIKRAKALQRSGCIVLRDEMDENSIIGDLRNTSINCTQHVAWRNPCGIGGMQALNIK